MAAGVIPTIVGVILITAGAIHPMAGAIPTTDLTGRVIIADTGMDITGEVEDTIRHITAPTLRIMAGAGPIHTGIAVHGQVIPLTGYGVRIPNQTGLPARLYSSASIAAGKA